LAPKVRGVPPPNKELPPVLAKLNPEFGVASPDPKPREIFSFCTPDSGDNGGEIVSYCKEHSPSFDI
jgi:hypothetical protein